MANFLSRLFKKQETKTETNETVQVNETVQASSDIEVLSPLAGQVTPLKDIADPVFSQEMMGKGIAIEPTEGKVVAPFNGTVAMLFDTKHAIGLMSDEGVELLIHVGMDTVQLKGEGFTTHVKNGDRISTGDLLVEFDMSVIKEAGYQTTTPIVITNTTNYESIEGTTESTVVTGDHLLKISK